MKYGPLLFLGLLLALALSWLGMIATPQLQLADEQPTNVPPSNVLYPTPHSGLANLGREVYRANGCAYCHTQVVRQEGTQLAVVLAKPGTNDLAVVEALVQLRRDLSALEAQQLLALSPVTVLTSVQKSVADAAADALSKAGAEVTVRVIPIGPEIQRGWGMRLSVARDYLYEYPLMLGSTRLGPDLTSIGLRQPEAAWHLVHLYDPKLQVAGSIMPRYPFLFEKRPRGPRPSADALPVPGDLEIIPKREAHALAAYLLSLRAQVPLFEAPAPPLPPSTGGTGDTNQAGATGAATNAPAGGPATNAAATNQPGPR